MTDLEVVHAQFKEGITNIPKGQQSKHQDGNPCSSTKKKRDHGYRGGCCFDKLNIQQLGILVLSEIRLANVWSVLCPIGNEAATSLRTTKRDISIYFSFVWEQ